MISSPTVTPSDFYAIRNPLGTSDDTMETPITSPEILYKYRYCDANALSLLAADKLYLARVEAFNDPFEFLIPAATIGAAATDDPDAIFARIEHEHRSDKVHASMRVCAFSEISDDLLMWGHYADCHKGFCIRFEFANDAQIPRMLFPIEYQPSLPDYNQPIKGAIDIVRIRGLTKSDKWAYEREWRIIGHVAADEAHTGEFRMPYTPASITGIIFGLRTPTLHKELIRKILQDHSHVKYFHAYKRHDEFALSFREITTPKNII